MIRAAISTREVSVQLDRRFHYKAKKGMEQIYKLIRREITLVELFDCVY
jgi:hypothetical protein